MAAPTLSDVMAELAAIRALATKIELEQRQQTALLTSLVEGLQLMSQEQDALAAQVTASTTVEQSALTLIQGIAGQIADAAGDRAKSLALAAQLKTSADALSAAVVANTPAAPASPQRAG